MSYEIVEKPAYRAMGLKTEVMYNNVSGLQKALHSMKNRINEFQFMLDASTQLGLSYHLHPNGYVHYAAFKVDARQPLLKGMVELHIPAFTYVKTRHRFKQEISKTYQALEEYLSQSPYSPYTDKQTAYFNSLPIKHESYSIENEHEVEAFDIWIPVKKKELA